MKRITMTMGVLAVAVIAAPQARAQAVITNGKVALGVNAAGALNVRCSSGAPGTATTARCTGGGNGVGVLNTLNNHESTYDGCTCEGWGFGTSDGATTTFLAGQNTAVGGTTNPGVNTFTFDASTATSTITVAGLYSISQFYHPSSVTDLYQVDVTITNLSTTDALGVGAAGLRYRREMDWDIEPTAFNEYSTIHGVGATGLLHSSDNGFVSSDVSSSLGNSCGGPGTIDANFYHSGPCDHGAAFDFGFPALDAGLSQSFSIFYGVADNESLALSDLGAVNADDIYSLAQHNAGCGAVDACIAAEETFIFGFKGIKGAVTLGTPEPASIALMGKGLAGLARRRAAKKA